MYISYSTNKGNIHIYKNPHQHFVDKSNNIVTIPNLSKITNKSLSLFFEASDRAIHSVITNIKQMQ
jgi:hypothetical protein